MSHHRKNSVRDKVIGNNQVQRETHSTDRVWAVLEGESGSLENIAWLAFKGWVNHEIKTFAPWKKSYDKPRQCIKKERHHFADKGPYS